MSRCCSDLPWSVSRRRLTTRILTLLRDGSVWAPQYGSAATSIAPMLSRSVRVFVCVIALSPSAALGRSGGVPCRAGLRGPRTIFGARQCGSPAPWSPASPPASTWLARFRQGAAMFAPERLDGLVRFVRHELDVILPVQGHP